MITIQNINFYTVDEVAKELNITPLTVRTYIRQNKIKAQRIGRPYLISEGSLREFLTKETKPTEETK